MRGRVFPEIFTALLVAAVNRHVGIAWSAAAERRLPARPMLRLQRRSPSCALALTLLRGASAAKGSLYFCG